MTVDDQCEILVFPSVEGRCHGSRILLVLAHGCRWTQVASGAAGRVNVGFCPASSLQRCAEDISSAARNDSWKYLEKIRRLSRMIKRSQLQRSEMCLIVCIYLLSCSNCHSCPRKLVTDKQVVMSRKSNIFVKSVSLLLRYEMYFKVRSKADISQLNLPHGTNN